MNIPATSSLLSSGLALGTLSCALTYCPQFRGRIGLATASGFAAIALLYLGLTKSRDEIGALANQLRNLLPLLLRDPRPPRACQHRTTRAQ